MQDTRHLVSNSKEAVLMQRDWVPVFVGLGANLGEARYALEAAVQTIGKLPNTRVMACSSFYRSAPVDAAGPDYINAVIQLETRLNAYELLRAFQALEILAGRERPYRHAPRTLDIDLLLFGSASIQSLELQVPHPRMRERAFVLLPLWELAPHCVSKDDLRRVQDQAIQRMH
jgi:2-amino-4-hydroxy-6-hydroxymethyldihydropteridine diphosphokinase